MENKRHVERQELDGQQRSPALLAIRRNVRKNSTAAWGAPPSPLHVLLLVAATAWLRLLLQAAARSHRAEHFLDRDRRLPPPPQRGGRRPGGGGRAFGWAADGDRRLDSGRSASGGRWASGGRSAGGRQAIGDRSAGRRRAVGSRRSAVGGRRSTVGCLLLQPEPRYAYLTLLTYLTYLTYLLYLLYFTYFMYFTRAFSWI